MPKSTYMVINKANRTFGYDIVADGQILIINPVYMALPGHTVFKFRATLDESCAW